MGDTYTELFLHCVWATHGRLPLVGPEHEARVYGVIRDKCAEFGCKVIALGGCADRLHLVITFVTTETISKVVGEAKGASSYLMNHEFHGEPHFRWQNGYGVFSMEKRSLPRLVAYVRNQKTHHADGTIAHRYEPRDDDVSVPA